MLMTPGGTPASSISSPSRSEVSGASSAGFRTTVQPVASAGPTFQTVAPKGPFHGMIAPTTPTGSFKVYDTYSPGIEFLDRLAMYRHRHSGVPTQHAQHSPASTACAVDRRAHIQRVEEAEFVEMLLDQIGQFQQDLLPLVGLHLAPSPINSATC